MALPPSSRIGAYEILGLLGEGGMGQVYRATDTNLKRQVALKVLPDSVAGDAERLARFQREAEVLAALNHPHIAAIYGLERSGSTTALVMELVEGEDLSERIARGAIALDDALPLARQIAEALEAAHGQGIIHRDLKPANIKVRTDGTVKVLDFGLAKAMDPPGSSTANAMNSPTLSIHATQAGMILGTAAYMSPEQARGAIVDKRADIWAFGVVLYEMLTGQRLFDGETVSDTLASVLKTDVDWSRLPNETPASVRRLLRHCLARDRKQRLQDIGDARLELSEGGAHDVVALSPSAPVRTPWLRLVATFVAGAAVTFAGGAAWMTSSAPTAAQDSDRAYTFLITPADGVALEDPPNFAVSPNGRSILLRGFDQGIAYWYVKDLATGTLRRLSSTQGATGWAAWSPDSDWIVFARQSTLHKLAIDDTRLEAMSNRGAAFGGVSWSPSGELLRVTDGRLIAIRAPGAPAHTVIEASETLRLLQWPWALPDGKQLLIGEASDPTGDIFIAKLDGSEPPRALEKGSQPAFAAPNWLLAVRGQQLLAWQFDPVGAVVEGPPKVISSGIRTRGGLGGRLFSASQTGVLAVRNDAASEVTQLTWFDRRGTEGAQLKLTRHCRNPELSRDYRRVAMECYEGATRDIWLYDLARDAVSRFTTDPADDSDPVWSPDGRTLVFSSNRKGAADVFRKSLGGATSEELMMETPGSTPVMAWSPDGKSIVVLEGGTQDLIGYEAGASLTPTPIVADAFTSLELQFSPDGRFISYSSDESGRAEIYVQPWPQTGEKWQVSTDGATDGRWRADGRELFFLSPTRELMAVSIDAAKGFRAGTPIRLFQTAVAGPLGSGHRFPYAVSADGQRFLIYVNDRNAPPPSISVIVNWPALLKK
ncbi:MAG: protein kinase [Acidobacteriota bacterium]|nr:protein kinase [Acidobacteriota bacterium]